MQNQKQSFQTPFYQYPHGAMNTPFAVTHPMYNFMPFYVQPMCCHGTSEWFKNKTNNSDIQKDHCKKSKSVDSSDSKTKSKNKKEHKMDELTVFSMIVLVCAIMFSMVIFFVSSQFYLTQVFEEHVDRFLFGASQKKQTENAVNSEDQIDLKSYTLYVKKKQYDHCK